VWTGARLDCTPVEANILAAARRRFYPHVMAQDGTTSRRDWTVIGLVSYPHMFSHIYGMVLPPLLTVLKGEFDVSYTQLGILISVFGVASGLGQTPVGFLVDRWGARPVLVIGTAIEGLAILGIGLSDSYWQLLVLYTVAGVFNSVYHPADYAILAAQVAKKRLGRAIGVHSFVGNLGWAITPMFMAGVTAIWGWRAAFIAIGALGLLFVPVLLARWSLIANIADANAAAKRKAAPDTSAKAGIALLLSTPILMCFAFYVLQGMGFGGMRSFFIAATAAAHGTPFDVANYALSGMMLFAAIGILAGGWLADLSGKTFPIAVGSLTIAGVGVALVGAFALPGFALVAILSLTGFTQGVFNPVRDLMVRSITPDGQMGKVMGFVSSGMNLSSGIVPLVYGWLMDRGEPQLVIYLSAGMVAVALFTFVGVKTQVVAPEAAAQRAREAAA
jgi:MFS transporter, FSR family, fosmidomycin resistance protein